MMKKAFFIPLVILMVGAFVLIGSVQTSTAKTLEIKVVGSNPKPDVSVHWQHQALRKVIEEKSKGAIKIDFIGGNDVIPANEQWDAVKSGAINAVWTPLSRAGGIFPEANALPLSKMSAAEMRANGFFDLYNKSFQKANIYFLMNGDSSRFEQFLRIYINVKINKPEDLKGIKIATTPGEAPIVKAFGGVPVMMSPFGRYEALDRGLVKGAGATADDTVFRFSYVEVCKYFISPGFGGPSYAWAFNLDFWKSIPENLQKLILESVIEVEKEWEPKWTEIHKGWPEKWVKKGGMEEILFAGEDGKRFAQAYYDYHWADIIARSPVNGPKLKKLAGQ